ncbi:MAG TPA: aminotransferase class IV [Pyrinomonadaceae bacterium]|nr:aminotransferase class IV [Pyrinomonadaceae bacterium]
MSGRGIFTTIAIRDGRPFLWRKHWSRLIHAAEKLSIDLGEFREDDVLSLLAERLSQDGLMRGRAKITFTDERPGALWPASRSASANTSLSIVTGPQRETAEEFRLGISPFPVNARSPLAGLKTTDYLEPTLCFEAARRSGFDEAVRVNQTGEVVGACFANVFWLKGGERFTPALSTGCLAGTTREFILENLAVQETAAKIDELLLADAVFLTSAGIGIVPAASLGEKTFPPADHSILEIISAS